MSGDFRIRRAWWGWMGLLLLGLLPALWLRFPLPPDSALVELAWWVSLSGSKYGIPLVGLLLLLVLRPGRRELPRLVLPALLFLGVGAAFNEHLLKPWLNQPRPDIRWLASPASGPVLPEGAEAFYRLPDKTARSRRLAHRLAVAGPALPPRVAEHWIEETGFSFPSGHAFASAALAGWFTLWVLCLGRRSWLLPLLVAWSLSVAWSRLVLGVHRPEDVLTGAAQGVLLAWAVGFLVQRWRRRRVTPVRSAGGAAGGHSNSKAAPR